MIESLLHGLLIFLVGVAVLLPIRIVLERVTAQTWREAAVKGWRGFWLLKPKR